MKAFYGTLAVATLFFGISVADDNLALCSSMIAACAYCLQKAGVVNWAEEIKKED